MSLAVCNLLSYTASLAAGSHLLASSGSDPSHATHLQAAPIVRVAIEPTQPADMPRLMEGLRLLNRADPLAEVTVQETGEHVLGAAGARKVSSGV